MESIKIKQKILAFIIIGTIVVVNTKIVFFNDTSLSLHSITNAFAYGEFDDDDWQEEQDWIRQSRKCFNYYYVMGVEYEEVCDCTYDIGICPLGSVDDCFDEGGIHQIGGKENCRLNGNMY
jgi:hypothetical protein